MRGVEGEVRKHRHLDALGAAIDDGVTDARGGCEQDVADATAEVSEAEQKRTVQ